MTYRKKPDLNSAKVRKDIENNRLIAAIGYIGLLALVPLLLKKDSDFAQFHGKQGFTILIGWVITFFIGIFPIVGWLISFVLTIFLLAVSIIGFFKSLQGKYWEAPYIAERARKIFL